MKPKHILTLSVLAGLAAVLLVQLQLRSERGETVTLFRATETLGVGQTLGGQIETVTLPGDKLFPNLLKEAPTQDMREYVTSTPLREVVHAGQIVLYRHLEASADPGLRALIPIGKRAFSLEVDSASSVAFLVEPQDRVDVLAALPSALAPTTSAIETPGADPTSFDPAAWQRAVASGSFGPDMLGRWVDASTDPPDRGSMRTETLLEDVEVLAVGRRFRKAQPRERGESYDTVTLLVSQAQAETLAHARDVQNSPMTLVLRGADEPPLPGVEP